MADQLLTSGSDGSRRRAYSGARRRRAVTEPSAADQPGPPPERAPTYVARRYIAGYTILTMRAPDLVRTVSR